MREITNLGCTKLPKKPLKKEIQDSNRKGMMKLLTEYFRSVTIVTNPERGFLNHQITHFHRQVPGF